MTDLRWWAVHCQSQKEALADLWLRRGGFLTYFPHTRIKPRWEPSENNEFTELKTRKPFLPRYLFVKAEAGQLGAVNDTMGVSTVVHAPGGEPFPIAPKVIEDMRAFFESQGYRNPAPKPKFSGKIGDLVKGREGWPHWGLIAMVSEICGDHLILELGFKSASKVSVPVDSIEPIDADEG